MTDHEKEQRRAAERQAMREAAKAVFPEYLRTVHGLSDSQINGKKLLRCLNPQHNDSDASMRYYPDESNPHLFCFGCRARYDLPALIAADSGTTISDAAVWETLKRWTGSADHYFFQSGNKRGAAPEQSTEEKKRAEQPQDFTAFFEECESRRSDRRFIEYMKMRGISLDTCDIYGIGFAPEWKYPGTNRRPMPHIIIPTGRSSYTARLAMPEPPAGCAKVLKIGGSNPLYNLPAFLRNTALFITEGELDTVSIEQCGGSAAALGSTANASKLLQLIPALCKDRTAPVIIMTDADSSGRKAAAELAQGFAEMRRAGQIPAFRVLNFTAYPEGTNDPNDLLKQSPDLLTAIIRKVGFIENTIDRLARIAGISLVIIDETREGILI